MVTMVPDPWTDRRNGVSFPNPQVRARLIIIERIQSQGEAIAGSRICGGVPTHDAILVSFSLDEGGIDGDMPKGLLRHFPRLEVTLKYGREFGGT